MFGVWCFAFCVLVFLVFFWGELFVVGCWWLVVGGWRLVVGGWLFVVACWLLVDDCWLLDVCCWLFVVIVSCWSFVVGRWLLFVGFWSVGRLADWLVGWFVGLLFIVYCFVFGVCCLVCVV